MEKNAQIGELVAQRQEQKITLEHLRLKGKKIVSAYSAFASAPERWRVDEPTGRGYVFLLHPIQEERDHPQYLLGQKELAEHIREVTAAEQALVTTRSQLTALGISD